MAVAVAQVGEWSVYRHGVWIAMAEDGSWWWALSRQGYPEYGPYFDKTQMIADADAWISWTQRDGLGYGYPRVRYRSAL